MSTTVLVNLSSPLWPALEERVSQAVLATLDAEGMASDPVEVGILLTNDEESRQLNWHHRNLNRPANVLSFAMEDGETFPDVEEGVKLLGDIVIPYETTLAEATEFGVSLEARLIHLVVHGVLHLLGYDHERSQIEADKQEYQERLILAKLDIADPYA